MNQEPRYVVGIDLGTTNSAVCYVDTEQDPWCVETLAVSQLVSAGQTEERDGLPSFHYEPAEGEFSAASVSLPWQDGTPKFITGVMARDHGVQVPGRLITSAKSWLCHAGVDRTAGILPWQGNDDAQRLSPVEVSARYLAHLAGAWNHRFPQYPLSEQTVVLTIPASFDEVARNLTVRAAQSAGLPRVLLIEEPQAAFYAWLDRHRDDWQSRVSPGQKILVCDVGGGTTDFTLIRVRASDGPADDASVADDPNEQEVAFRRVAVGEHLILGGDNLDLALAQHIEQQLQSEGHGDLSSRQYSSLIRLAREVKEILLGTDPPDSYTVSLPGGGSKLIGGAIQTTVLRTDVESLLVDGFLPLTELSDDPAAAVSGFREFGLPYASDSAVSRYLARFLRQHAEEAADNSLLNDDAHPARPDIVLFNGGLFESPVLRDRMVRCLSRWFSDQDHEWHPEVLDCRRLDLAVAQGAACFGMVSRGCGMRISAGLPRTYYIGVHSSEGDSAVCLIPAGTEPGTEPASPDQVFTLTTGRPVEFPVYYSGTRLTDPVGRMIPVEGEQLTALPPIRTVIRDRSQGDQTDVRLDAGLTEIGTLDLWCRTADESQRWKLQFDVRSAVQTDRTGHQGSAETGGIAEQTDADAAEGLLRSVFGRKASQKPGGLLKRISEVSGIPRSEWPPSLLREIWSRVFAFAEGRRKSPSHEAAWLSIAGFCLRPGFGYALDDWRVECMWETLRGRMVHASPQVTPQWWIMWRRLAGGLTGGQQTALSGPVLSSVRQTVTVMRTGRGKPGPLSIHDRDAAEIWRVLGSFELLDPGTRREIGTMVLELLPRKKMSGVREPLVWCLGRLGARVPLNGNSQSTIEAGTAERWIAALLKDPPEQVSGLPLALMQLARRTGDRFTDVSTETRNRVIEWLRSESASSELIRLVRDGGPTDAETSAAVFGESLPMGLKVGG